MAGSAQKAPSPAPSKQAGLTLLLAAPGALKLSRWGLSPLCPICPTTQVQEAVLRFIISNEPNPRWENQRQPRAEASLLRVTHEPAAEMGLRGSETIRGIDCIWSLAARVRPDTPSQAEPPRLTIRSPPCVARPPGRSPAFQSWGTALSEPWFHRGTGGRRGGSLPREGTNPLLLQDHRPNRVFRGMLLLTKHRISPRLGFETIRGPALLGDKETGSHGAQPCSLDAPWGRRAIFSIGSVLGHAAKLPSRCLCVSHPLLRLDCALVTSHPGVHVLEMALWSSHRRQTWNVLERSSGWHPGHRTRKSLRFPDFSSAFPITDFRFCFISF